MEQVSIRVPDYHLRAIALLAANNDIRYYLNSVFIEATPSETRVTATCGRCLGTLASETANGGVPKEGLQLIVPMAAIKAVPKTRIRDALTLFIEPVSETHWSITWGDNGALFKPLEAKYPEWRKVIPEAPSGEAAQFNPELLMKFVKVQKALSGAGADRHFPRVMHNGHGGALVKLAMVPNFTGVVMPVRMPDA